MLESLLIGSFGGGISSHFINSLCFSIHTSLHTPHCDRNDNNNNTINIVSAWPLVSIFTRTLLTLFPPLDRLPELYTHTNTAIADPAVKAIPWLAGLTSCRPTPSLPAVTTHLQTTTNHFHSKACLLAVGPRPTTFARLAPPAGRDSFFHAPNSVCISLF